MSSQASMYIHDNHPYNLTQWALSLGGLLTFAIGVMHIFMPEFGYDASVPQSMDTEVANHFYYLGTYAIASFLLTFGFLSIYLARQNIVQAMFPFALVLTGVWGLRAVLEIIYPVKLSLFFLDTPTTALLPITIILTVLYSFSAYQLWQQYQQGH